MADGIFVHSQSGSANLGGEVASSSCILINCGVITWLLLLLLPLRLPLLLLLLLLVYTAAFVQLHRHCWTCSKPR
jgi:hypothetical protein